MVFEIFITISLIEIIMISIIFWLKKDFQWLINSNDEKIKFNEKKLTKFFNHGFDTTLGWKRKENTHKTEEIKGVGEFIKNPKFSNYKINSYAARENLSHEKYKKKIITFGDSYAFCRHVNDNETWQWHLSKLTKTNVVNFGVGNYGVDQALQNLNKEIDNYKGDTKIVIMMVVPETITRIVNIWKHFNEYGNTFGFKGRYFHDKDDIQWHKNPIDSFEKFKKLDKYLEGIKTDDYCYKHKFLKDKLSFPYSVTIMKNYKRNLPLIYQLIIRKILNLFQIRNENLINKPWNHVLKNNKKFSDSLYSKKNIRSLLKKIILKFKNDVKERGMTPVFVMAPYLHDISKNSNDKNIFYKSLLNDLEEDLMIIDLNDRFLYEKNKNELYVSPYYGAHLNQKGNSIAASYIYSTFKKKKIL